MQNKLEPKDIIHLWNKLVGGYYRKVRLVDVFLNDSKTKTRMNKAVKDMPEVSMWEIAIKQAIKNFEGDNSDFWWSRKGKDGLSWFLQRRSKGQGEFNYLYYYETGMDATEEVAKVEELFSFDKEVELP